MKIQKMQWLYALLALAGLVIPMTSFLPWLAQHGLALVVFRRELFANRISSFFSADLLLTAVGVLIFAFMQRSKVRLWWVPALATIFLGVSVGLPLLLSLRAGIDTER